LISKQAETEYNSELFSEDEILKSIEAGMPPSAEVISHQRKPGPVWNKNRIAIRALGLTAMRIAAKFKTK
jgi:hypothetical protein